VQDRGPAAYIAEFFGTLALVFFVTTAVSVWVSSAFVDFAVIGLVHVFVLFFLIQTLALVSGAHFNPAITVALAAVRQIKVADALIYILAQLAGGVAGALLTKLLLDKFPNADVQHFGAVAISDRLSGEVGRAMLGEFLGTFFLVWAVVGVAVNPRAAKDWAALTIGATLGLGVMVIGPLTGGSFNPARAFGPALVASEFGDAKDFVLAYVVAPVIGGLAAALAYVNLFIAPGAKGPEGMEPVG
jgi:glycerol uptake facilitator